MKYFNTYKKIYLSQVALIALILLIGWICLYFYDQPYWSFYFLGEYRYLFDDFWWDIPLSFGYALLYIALPLLFYIFTDILRFKKVRRFLQKLYNIFIYLCLGFNVFLIFFFWYERYSFFEYFNNPWYEDVWRTIGFANSSPINEKFYDLIGLSPYIIIIVILFLILKLNKKAKALSN